jgi:rare lipoprotein A
MDAMTAAHKELPFGTMVEVRNLDNGKTVRVRINDRGPFVRGRVIDLSRAGARAIDMLGPGTARVELRARLDAPATGPANFTVQVGSFRDRDRALDLAAKLRSDYDVDVRAADGWHRVQVGGRRSREAAKRLAADLRRRGYEAFAVGLG